MKRLSYKDITTLRDKQEYPEPFLIAETLTHICEYLDLDSLAKFHRSFKRTNFTIKQIFFRKKEEYLKSLNLSGDAGMLNINEINKGFSKMLTMGDPKLVHYVRYKHKDFVKNVLHSSWTNLPISIVPTLFPEIEKFPTYVHKCSCVHRRHKFKSFYSLLLKNGMEILQNYKQYFNTDDVIKLAIINGMDNMFFYMIENYKDYTISLISNLSIIHGFTHGLKFLLHTGKLPGEINGGNWTTHNFLISHGYEFKDGVHKIVHKKH